MVGAKLVKIDKFCPLTHVALGSSPLQPSFFICIIISFVAAWLARALLSFKRAQSSGNDDADERQHVPFGACNFPVSFRSLTLIKANIPGYE